MSCTADPPYRANASGQKESAPPHNPAYGMATAAPLALVDPTGLQGYTVPERRWVVEGLIPVGNVTMLSGDGGLGKTLVTQQLCTAAATGRQWLGLPTLRCRSLSIFCEDDSDETWRRQQQINDHYGVEFRDLDATRWTNRVGEDNALLVFKDGAAGTTDFYREVLETAESFGAQIVVLDSLHDLFVGNENSRIDARKFVSALRQIALRIDGAVILNAHPSLAGRNSGTGEAGSTAWNNAVRSRLYLTRPADGDPNERTLATMKNNYGPAGGKISLLWHEGVFAPREQARGVFAGIERRRVEQVFLGLIRKTANEGRPVSESRNANNYAPRLFANRPDRDGFKLRDFEEAMERLFASGRIRMEQYGRQHDLRRRIVVVPPAKTEADE